MKRNSYNQIVNSSALIGGASLISLIIGLLKTKVVAELLGPVGVGAIGLLQNLMTAASGIAGLGFGPIGTRQIAMAESKGDLAGIAAARRALFWGTLILAVGGGVLFWLSREAIASYSISDGQGLGWLAFGVALSVGSASQTALLRGMRRLGDMARVSVFSAVFGCALGILTILVWRDAGIVGFVITAPLGSFLVGHFYVAKLSRIEAAPTPLKDIFSQWATLARLGTALAVTGLVVTLAQLQVRVIVGDSQGQHALGQFQASWAIASTYVGVIITAMGTDFYPRLAAVIGDKGAMRRLVNEQTEVVLLLSSPIFMAIIALSPWIIHMLYSKEFKGAGEILKWQMLGNCLKIASWPIGLSLLVSGQGRAFLFAEVVGSAVFVAITAGIVEKFGVIAPGIAFVGMYAIRLALVMYLTKRILDAWLGRRVLMLTALVVGACMLILVVSEVSQVFGALCGIFLGAISGCYAVARLNRLGALPARIASLMNSFTTR